MITGNPKPRGLISSISGRTPKHKVLEFRLSKVGFPIRKSVDQSFFAAPHGLSQRSTSFIASQRQGIHRTPLRHLIALIINVHTLGRMLSAQLPLKARILDERDCRSRTLTRKTSLLRKIGPIARRSSFATKIVLQLDHLTHLAMSGDERAPKTIWRLGMTSANCSADPNSDRSPLYDVRKHARHRPSGPMSAK